jgi:hypothetical protein
MAILALLHPIHSLNDSFLQAHPDQASNCGLSLRCSTVGCSHSIVMRLIWGISLSFSTHVSQESRNDGSCGTDYPRCLDINGLPKQEPRPAIWSLPSGLGEPIAVIHVSPRSGSSAATTAAALCSSRPVLGSVLPGESKVMSSKVVPSSSMHSPVCRANATMTATLLRRSSIAIAPTVCIPRPRPSSLS